MDRISRVSIPSRYDPNKCCSYCRSCFDDCFNPFKVRSKHVLILLKPADKRRFQSLQGTIQTAETGLRKSSAWFVSIPSRYDPNRRARLKWWPLWRCFNPFKVRSKPRRSRSAHRANRRFNPFKVRSKPRSSYRPTSTILGFNPFKVRSKPDDLVRGFFRILDMFQSLQGTIQTPDANVGIVTGAVFQSLQGTIQTQKVRPLFFILPIPVSIPSRYDPNSFSRPCKPEQVSNPFQSLQGTIQTNHWLEMTEETVQVSIPSRYDPNDFIPVGRRNRPGTFQSLQGTIQTCWPARSRGPNGHVSIPSRYDPNRTSRT